MKRVLIGIVLAFFAFVSIGADAPVLNYKADRVPVFEVTFEPGVEWGCAVFHSLTETIEMDGKTVPYEPRDCGPTQSTKQSKIVFDWGFVEPNGGEWDVWVELQRPIDPDQQVVEFTSESSNVVRVKH